MAFIDQVFFGLPGFVDRVLFNLSDLILFLCYEKEEREEERTFLSHIFYRVFPLKVFFLSRMFYNPSFSR